MASHVLDEQFEMVSNVHRRRLLLSLLVHNPQPDRPAEPDRSDRAADERALTIELRHVHLPKLAAAGYVEWDRSTGTVIKGPRFDELEPLLTLLRENHEELPSDLFP